MEERKTAIFTVEYALNRSNPNEVPDLLRRIQAGSVLKGLVMTETETVAVTDHQAVLSNACAGYVAGKTNNGNPVIIVPAGCEVAASGEGSVEFVSLNGNTITLAADTTATSLTVEYHSLPDDAANLIAEWPSRTGS